MEKAFVKQQEMEKVARLAEKDRIDRERLEARKRREVQRITDVSIVLLLLLRVDSLLSEFVFVSFSNLK